MPGGMIGILRANAPAIYVYGGTIRPGHWKGKDLSIVSSFEALGMSPLYSSTMTNPDRERIESAAESGRLLVEAVKKNIRPRDIVTRKSIENAAVLIMAIGGSTNAMLHYLALARAAGVNWSLDDFERIRRKALVLCDLKPSGRYMAVDLHRAGGIPQVLKTLLDAGLIHGDCLTITGRTLAEELATIPSEPGSDQDVMMPMEKALYSQGHLAILRGNLAEDGAVAKITGFKSPAISGPARVFDDEQSAMEAILSDRIQPGDVVSRPEGRSGHARNAVSDLAATLVLRLEVDEVEIKRRRTAWTQPKARYTHGVLAKFAALAHPANEGAITG